MTFYYQIWISALIADPIHITLCNNDDDNTIKSSTGGGGGCGDRCIHTQLQEYWFVQLLEILFNVFPRILEPWAQGINDDNYDV